MRELRELLMQQRARRRTRGRSRTRRGSMSAGEGSRGSWASSPSRQREEVRVPVFDPRGRKMEVPIFNGDDAYAWIVRVERYFRLNEVLDEDKLNAVVLALEDRALNWYQWWEEQATALTWEEFKKAVIGRFQPGLVQNPLGPLLSIKQTGSVMEYREKFELLIAPLRKEERVMLESIFLNGLKEEIQAELKLHDSKSLSELMDRALLVEEKNLAFMKRGSAQREKGEWREGGGAKPRTGVGPNFEAGRTRSFRPKVSTNNSGPMDTKPPEGSSAEKGLGGGKRLSQAELQERSKKGLCFKCGDKWGPDHVCKFKHYQLVLIEAENEEEEPEFQEEEEQIQLDAKTLHLSLRSKEGLASNQSFKVWGKINNRPVLVLVDSGATSNFISKEIMKEMNLKVHETPGYSVQIGTGEQIWNKGVCKNLRLEVQGVVVEQNFFMMDLGGTEVVLGMDWLASLGDIKANFKNLIIRWRQGGNQLELKRDPSLCKTQASWKSMVKNLLNEGE